MQTKNFEFDFKNQCRLWVWSHNSENSELRCETNTNFKFKLRSLNEFKLRVNKIQIVWLLQIFLGFDSGVL